MPLPQGYLILHGKYDKKYRLKIAIDYETVIYDMELSSYIFSKYDMVSTIMS